MDERYICLFLFINFADHHASLSWETITSRMIGRCLSAIVSLGEIFLWRVSSHFLAHTAVSTRLPEDSLGIKARANICENAYRPT
jgi:hypothetical protein